MKVRINDEDRVIGKEEVSVLELLKISNVEAPETVSVQVNGSFVDRSVYGTTSLKEGDVVDFLYFMGGGGR